MIPNSHLIRFIKEARKRGFDDYQIKEPLLKQGWGIQEIDAAFFSLKRKAKPHSYYKNKITIYLDNELMKMIDKRARKNMFTLPEQIEDILRRSCVSMKKRTSIPSGKIDDLLVRIFSRQKRAKK